MKPDLWKTVQNLRAAFSQATSELPEQWTPDNSSIGQCHTSALVLQDLYGGEIVNCVAYDPDSDHSTLHFWNVIDGITLDITRDQFPDWTVYRDLMPAELPNDTTRRKADLLARLAGVTR